MVFYFTWSGGADYLTNKCGFQFNQRLNMYQILFQMIYIKSLELSFLSEKGQYIRTFL